MSHTQGLMDVSAEIMRHQRVSVDMIRATDFDIPPGVSPDMTEQGRETDDWPSICQRVMAADILVIGTPIWLGEKSSVCTRVIERLYGSSSELNSTASAPTTAGWRGVWSRATRTGSNTAP